MAKRGNDEGSLYHDAARDRWVAAVVFPDGKRRRRITRSRAEASRALRDLIDERDRGGGQLPQSATVADWLDVWLTQIVPARVAAPTAANYAAIARLHVVPHVGRIKLGRLTTEQVERMLRALAAEGLSRSTVVRARAVLSAAMKEALRRGHIARNPVSPAVTPPDARPPAARRSFTADQARQLLAAAHDDPLGAMWVLGLTRGLRPGELGGLCWDDLTLDARRPLLHLRTALRWDRPEPRRREPRLVPLKANAPTRSMTLPAATVGLLRRHRARQAEVRLVLAAEWSPVGAEHGGLVFTTTLGHAIDPTNLRRYFRRYLAAAGIPDPEAWTVNSLRHSCGSLLSDAGLAPEVIADLFGHVDTRMILRTYRHAVRPVLEAGADEWDVLLDAAFTAR